VHAGLRHNWQRKLCVPLGSPQLLPNRATSRRKSEGFNLRREEATPLCRENAAGTTFLDPLAAPPSRRLYLLSELRTEPLHKHRSFSITRNGSFYRGLKEETASPIVRTHKIHIYRAIFPRFSSNCSRSCESSISANELSPIARLAKTHGPATTHFQYIVIYHMRLLIDCR